MGTAPSRILELVEQFRRNRDEYRKHGLNETQLRREYLDPFFEALGWDVANRQGHAPAYREVIHEDAVKIGGVEKAPDYSFRIGGTRKFFVEAKNPAINLKDNPAPAYQLRRYAWSAKLPLSILTDFEEFVVYDCRTRPSATDKTSAHRSLYLTYDQYESQWDEIADIFAKDAVLKGSFDKYAASDRKRGTATVDAEFLAEIEQWREALAKNLAIRNRKLSVHDLNFAVQRTIDRIIFLRICEDRGAEHYGQLQALLNGEHTYGRLKQLFQQADDRYNSGLFHFQREKDRAEAPDELTLDLSVDDKVLKDILERLYAPKSPYEFSVFPAEILGQVYEQFLGKVIRLTAGHQARVEEKPEVKKAGGVYYTPAYIVDYIVTQTVGMLCKDKTPRQIETLRILDPACGSGSFLIGAYTYLMNYHRDWYVKDGAEKHKKELFQATGGEWRLTTQEKKRILLNNIYGVDIDNQAVEVTKLSLLLKVLEGESDETLKRQLSFVKERALPDLGQNIKCGNSLIGSDYFTGKMFPDEEEMRRVNPFDWQAGFPEIKKAGGFDAAIGNPPYGASLSEEATTYLLANFKLQEYQLDTYLLFLEKILILIKEKGLVGLIIPNTWLLNLQSNRIRQHLFSQTQIEKIVHYRRPVFDKATVDTEITIIRKESPGNKHQVGISIIEKDGSATRYAISQKRWQEGHGRPVNIFERPELAYLADKLKGSPVLDKVCLITQGAKPFQVGKGKPPQTRKVVEEKPFVSEKRRNSTFRPLLRGSLIQRYQILWNRDYWISFGDWLAEPRYSASYDAPDKIVIRQTGDSLVSTLDREQFVVRDNLYTIVLRNDSLDLRFVLGILNSRLLNWIYQTVINPEKGEALAQVKRGHLAQLPIATVDSSKQSEKFKHDKMVSLVERMLDLHKRLAATKNPNDQTRLQSQIDATDREIDRLVYDLYGLTDEEIAIVEGVKKGSSTANEVNET